MRWRGLLALASLLPAVPAAAQTDSAAFIIRLGRDTVAVERYVRTADRIVVEAVQRSPSTSLHRFEYQLAPDGSIRVGDYSTRPPQRAEPVGRRVFTLTSTGTETSTKTSLAILVSLSTALGSSAVSLSASLGSSAISG